MMPSSPTLTEADRSTPRAAARTSRGRRVAAALGAAAVAAGVTFTLVPDPVTVPLTVDGVSSPVSTRAGTVGELLADAGIDVGPADLVEPAVDAELGDRVAVTVVHARPVTLTVDGHRATRTVAANTLGEALGELSLDERGTYVSRSVGARIPLSGLDAVVRTPQTVTVRTVAGVREVTTTAPTVSALLAEVGADVDGNDRVSPDAESYPREGTRVRVVEVTVRRSTVRARLEHGTVRRTTDQLDVGQARVHRAGRDGMVVKRVRRVLHDGKVHRTRVLDRRVRPPRPRVLLVGTREPAEAETTSTASVSTSAGHLNWPALAQCESGGDPTIVSPNGLYYGLYQFSLPTWQSVGGTGLPSQASPAEQRMRAQMLYDRAGAGQWPVCGSRL